MRAEDTFVMAACTQLMTTIAALQCVERGLLVLDGDVTGVLPELRQTDILTGFDRKTDRPILVRSTNKITLRFVYLLFSYFPRMNSYIQIFYKFLSVVSALSCIFCCERFVSHTYPQAPPDTHFRHILRHVQPSLTEMVRHPGSPSHLSHRKSNGCVQLPPRP